jgi:NADPH:quinone reductase-like Zn-dependent oxidoreductase
VKAAVYRRYGPPPDVVEIVDVPKPLPREHEVLMEVRAASVNPLDAALMGGQPYSFRLLSGLRKPKVTGIGVDVAGQVEAVGGRVTLFKPGDAVFGLSVRYPDVSGVRAWISQGAFAEHVCAPQSTVVMKPENLTFEQAAAAPVASLTALQGLRLGGLDPHRRTGSGQIRPPLRVLIHGAAGGVGTFAVQIAKFFGAHVTGICGPRNVELLRSIGADQAVDYTQVDITREPPEPGHRYDLFFDCIGNHPLSACRQLLSAKGTYIAVGGPGSRWLIGLLARPLQMLALSRLVGQKLLVMLAIPNRDDLLAIRELLAAGEVTPVIDRCYGLADVPEALRYHGTKHARGKVVIRPSPALLPIA